MDSNDFELSLEIGNVVVYDKLDVTVLFKNSFGLRYLIEFPNNPLTINSDSVPINSLANSTWMLDNIDIKSTDSNFICNDPDINGFRTCSNNFYFFDYVITPVAILGNDQVDGKIRPGSTYEGISSECGRELYAIPRLRFTSEDFIADSQIGEGNGIYYYDELVRISPPSGCE